MAAPGLRIDAAPELIRHDLARARIPSYAGVVLEALRLGQPRRNRLRTLSDADYGKVFELCDPAQLTPMLHYLCRDSLPEWVRNRIAGNLRDYSRRFSRLKEALFTVSGTLEDHGIEFVVLKGLAHSPDFTPDPLLRAQGDIDIWCPGESVEAARAALAGIGYHAVGESQGRHLPPMVRETEWEWKGDYFASDLPIAVELHYELWDEQLERLGVPGEREFWDRRTAARFEGRRLPVLSKPDTLAFACLHLLMHILHGDLRLQRAWEIAHFLHTHAGDDEFWSGWQAHHADGLRRLEAVVMALTADWFAADLHPAVAREIERLHDNVQLWIERYALSPIEALFRPNKDEIWLHVALVHSRRDRCAVFLRRTFPTRVPAPAGPATPPPGQRTRRLRFVAARAAHHVRAMLPVLRSGADWFWAKTRLEGGFVRYQAAAALYSFGVVIFLLLYNLHLLALGFRENVLGQVASAMSLGSLLGAAPAAAVARRVGLRNAVLVAVLGCAAATLARALGADLVLLLATAFLHGVFFSFWAVSYSPAIAGLTTERNRRLGFSLACSCGMLVCVLGGVAGGRLPGLLGRLSAPRAAPLWVASAIIAAAALPAVRLRFPAMPAGDSKTYPRSRFVVGFLAALCCWSVAVGAFNPFFNAFFAQHVRMDVARIGMVFSVSQIVQALALLAAPAILKQLGEVRGIAAMQLATGAALVLLAWGPPGAAAALYVAYMSVQYMSEPGLFSMLMNRVAPGERSGASALYFLATSLAGSVAALAAGGAIARFGYSPVLAASAAVAAGAAMLFRFLVPSAAAATKSPTSS